MIYYFPDYTDEDELDTFKEEISVSGFDVLPPFFIFSSKGDGSGLQLNISPDNAEYVGEYTFSILITDSDSENSSKN